jgi:F0F1-type ATP synthase assembly protein I
MNDSPDSRPPLMVAMEWISRLTTIAVEMVIPGLIGYWIDPKLGTKPVCLILGTIAGFSLGIWHLVQLANAAQRPKDGNKPPERMK